MKSLRIPDPVYSVTLDGRTVTYTFRRSNRAKHMRITISAHSGVVVTFPSRMKRYVNPDEFVREKQEWVLRHLDAIKPIPPEGRLENGSRITIRGKELTLRTYRNGVVEPELMLAGEELHVLLPQNYRGDLKSIVRSWVREQASAAIEREAYTQAERIGVRFNRITVRDQKTKWGSCSRKGNLSFNWRLILFPPRVLRYIVIHELCHLRHFNHSQRFWDMVERFDPHYRDSVDWLKEHGIRMEGALR